MTRNDSIAGCNSNIMYGWREYYWVMTHPGCSTMTAVPPASISGSCMSLSCDKTWPLTHSHRTADETQLSVLQQQNSSSATFYWQWPHARSVRPWTSRFRGPWSDTTALQFHSKKRLSPVGLLHVKVIRIPFVSNDYTALRCLPDSPKLWFRVRVRVRVGVSAKRVSANRDWTCTSELASNTKCAATMQINADYWQPYELTKVIFDLSAWSFNLRHRSNFWPSVGREESMLPADFRLLSSDKVFISRHDTWGRGENSLAYPPLM